jgi:ABC-2 type transport system permease protein
MHKVLALVRANWLAAWSYRLRMLLSLASLSVTIVPFYFVANALQPTMADAIRTEGSHYFAFLVVGTMSYILLTASVNALPGKIHSGINTGTLEAMLSTPTRVGTILGGLVGYEFLWAAARGLVFLGLGILLGAQIAWGSSMVALGLLVLIVVAHVPFGLMAGALVIAFRTPGPLPAAILVSSGLLGGVYYPTSVIPTWFEPISHVLPLTYGLRALRQTLLEGMPLQAVAPDIMVLTGFTISLMVMGTLGFSLALRYARRAGTLAQY